MNKSEPKNREEKLEKVAKELQVMLPKANEPIGIRIIALFTLVGGLSLVGAAFTDIFGSTEQISVYVSRTITGIIALLIAYGLIKSMRWAIYLYAILVVIAILVNPPASFLLIAVLVYLIFNRRHLKKGLIDAHFETLYEDRARRAEENNPNKSGRI
ncbi:MAG: hypothetical protein COV31_00245 [Candidatus Yanofskybacteria bacterium CG10_big_fil_rev_8_21_14_0_10_46_23]|uniref:Uncharacterized protein n=1 Tax=Candidatus Yanofskybacteria bacterium CG10_big_fil_rev_8_21_14_0_10_46_23 TaxID=1975098 RepID=A0A2H0R6R9_9BACT|nr:MAG: hypothetical protein COV31_00245 [Candidatus Yanofskybacteria bacterium CG10_big_fil_rev_8_21_14_0_10_46_23]